MPLKPREEKIKRTSSTAFNDMERLDKWSQRIKSSSVNFLNSQFSKVKRSQGMIFMRLWKTTLIGKNKAQNDSKLCLLQLLINQC